MKKSTKAVLYAIISIIATIATVVVFTNVAIIGIIADLDNTLVPREALINLPILAGTMLLAFLSFYKYDSLKKEIHEAKAKRRVVYKATQK